MLCKSVTSVHLIPNPTPSSHSLLVDVTAATREHCVQRINVIADFRADEIGLMTSSPLKRRYVNVIYPLKVTSLTVLSAEIIVLRMVIVSLSI